MPADRGPTQASALAAKPTRLPMNPGQRDHTLADLIYEFGEERRSRRIARAIARSRPSNVGSVGKLGRGPASETRQMTPLWG
jgi:hypothetical protein